MIRQSLELHTRKSNFISQLRELNPYPQPQPQTSALMPRAASITNSIQKSIRYVRKVHNNKQVSLKFTNYQSKNTIIYKLNKFHYLDNQIYVIDMDVLKEMARVFKNPNSVQLINLDLCNLKQEEAVIFAKANWDNVRSLSLCNNKIGKGGVDALAKCHLSELKQFTLSDNELESQAIISLASTGWKKLQKLNLSFNYLKSEGLRNLQTNKWNNLKHLSLLSNGITNRGLVSLVKMRFPLLDHLLLSHNQLSDDGAQLLTRGNWPHLKVLDLDGNFIGDLALRYISRLSSYKLSKIGLYDGKTVIINKNQDAKVLPTMGGLKQLIKGNFQKLKVDIHLGKLGQISTSKFIRCPQVRDMMEKAHIQISLLSLGKSSC